MTTLAVSTRRLDDSVDQIDLRNLPAGINIGVRHVWARARKRSDWNRTPSDRQSARPATPDM
jgi:hypothetical protein